MSKRCLTRADVSVALQAQHAKAIREAGRCGVPSNRLAVDPHGLRGWALPVGAASGVWVAAQGGAVLRKSRGRVGRIAPVLRANTNIGNTENVLHLTNEVK